MSFIQLISIQLVVFNIRKICMERVGKIQFVNIVYIINFGAVDSCCISCEVVGYLLKRRIIDTKANIIR
jgi:hypothetical protein